VEPNVFPTLLSMTYTVLHILFTILFIYLSVNIAYLLILSLAGLVPGKKAPASAAEKKRIAVLITSYNEDEVIVNTVKGATQHNYPSNKFRVYVAADHLQPSTIALLKELNAEIHEVKFATGSKARSLNYLLNTIGKDKYDIALVLDGDNIMLPGFLEKVNASFQQGFASVQAHRTAKNSNTAIAILDGISEEINNHLFRRGQRAIGFSSTLIGSGMAFEFEALRNIYNKPGILDNPACDREVDFEMMKAGTIIEYRDDAILLDEKVSTKNVFQNQRRRWLESQLSHLRLFFSRKERVNRRSKDYWNKLFINLIPPRITFIGIFSIVFVICIIQYFSDFNITGMRIRWWTLLFVAYALSMLISIPRRFFTFSTLRAFAYLPAILFSYIGAFFTMKSGRKEFVHTPKTFTGTTGKQE
jgi:cellulose synthase/poly-beta-1,6-N-acetylglucosamine synthase-like glycosyltransferase